MGLGCEKGQPYIWHMPRKHQKQFFFIETTRNILFTERKIRFCEPHVRGQAKEPEAGSRMHLKCTGRSLGFHAGFLPV